MDFLGRKTISSVTQEPILFQDLGSNQSFHATNPKVNINNEISNIIIEYDGFKEHFNHLHELDETNYQDYYKESDIKREKVL